MTEFLKRRQTTKVQLKKNYVTDSLTECIFKKLPTKKTPTLNETLRNENYRPYPS